MGNKECINKHTLLPGKCQSFSAALSNEGAGDAQGTFTVQFLMFHKQPLSETPQMFTAFIDWNDVVVVNVGLHYIPNNDFVAIFDAMLPIWKAKMNNQTKILMWRETTAQHFVGDGLYHSDFADRYK